jgi:hypothetical protein
MTSASPKPQPAPPPAPFAAPASCAGQDLRSEWGIPVMVEGKVTHLHATLYLPFDFEQDGVRIRCLDPDDLLGTLCLTIGQRVIVWGHWSDRARSVFQAEEIGIIS